MSRNHWFKMSHDLFQNAKIKHLRKMPDGDGMVLLWVFLLTLPKPLSGKLQLAAGVGMTKKDISELAEMDEALVDKAFEQMIKLKMLREKDGFYYVVGWRNHQQSDSSLRQQRLQNNARQAKCRQAKKEQKRHAQSDEKKQKCHATIREEKNRKEEKREEKDIVSTVFDRYDTLCPSLLKRGELTPVRRKDVLELINTFGDQQITLLFEKAERSRFLRGDNARGWRAGLPWLVQPHNAAKVLDGLYDDAPSGTAMTAYERSALQEMLED